MERGSGRGFFDESAAAIGAEDGIFDPNPDPDEVVAPVAPVGRGSRSHRSNQIKSPTDNFAGICKIVRNENPNNIFSPFLQFVEK